MDEEKQKQNKEELKQKAKTMTQKVLKSVIMSVIGFLLKAIIAVIIATFIVTVIKNIIETMTSEASKTADAYAVDYSASVTDESSDNRIIVDVNNVSANGAYTLNYEFKDEDGNILTEEESITKIKSDLIEENDKLNLNEFSDSELKVIGALMYNGLLVDKYTEEELKALVIFVKADIASQSFDLRSSAESEKEITLEDVENSDEVYGTVQIYRTKIEVDEEGQISYSKVKLEYIPYGSSATSGTFCYMVNQNDAEVLNKFSLDEDGELVIAKWSTTNVEYTYLDKDGNELSEEDKAQIDTEYLEDELGEESDGTNIAISTSIDYKKYIEDYVANYGLLSDLLTVTQNADFCLELAELAFNSKIVINAKEELTTRVNVQTKNYVQTTLLHDYVKYEVSGQEENTTTTLEIITSGSGNPNSVYELSEQYGWSSALTHTENGNEGGTWVFTWKDDESDNEYRLDYGYISNSWKLYKVKKVTVSTPLSRETNENEDGDLINLNNNHIKEEYEYYAIDEDYTDEETFEYTIVRKTTSESNLYDFEIAEVDTWYLKYNKQYNAPTISTPAPTSGEVNSSTGEYSEDLVQVLNTTNSEEINADSHVSEFIAQKEENYKTAHPSATTAVCNVTELTVKQRVKTDIQGGEYTETVTKYNFGEDVADTTEVEYKNIEYINNELSFTEEDEEGNPEKGFLYIYNKYLENGVDLFLQNDAEQQLFELLEADTDTEGFSDVIKYLLYAYDGIDRGVTTLKIQILDIKLYSALKGTAIENYIKAWENPSIWLYEIGESSVVPTAYMTADGEFYIVFEDGSAGHNNIACGIATFINCSEDRLNAAYRDDYGWGYYNWKSYFEAEGISLEDLYEGAYVEKEIVDSIFDNKILPGFVSYVEDYLETNLPEYEFSQEQKDALTAVAYQYGNIKKFADAYVNSLNEDGTLDAEKLKNNFEPFNYTGTIGNRKYANWLLFTEGTYLDSNGNEIVAIGGNIVAAAKAVHDYMSDPEHLYYYCTLGGEGDSTKQAHRSAGLYDCGLNTFENSKIPGKYGYRLTCCSTYVSWVLEEAGLLEIDEHVNGQLALLALLIKKGWTKIENYEEMEPGDVVFMYMNSDGPGHVQIYIGDGCWYNAGSNDKIHLVEPYYADLSDIFVYAYRQPDEKETTDEEN